MSLASTSCLPKQSLTLSQVWIRSAVVREYPLSTEHMGILFNHPLRFTLIASALTGSPYK